MSRTITPNTVNWINWRAAQVQAGPRWLSHHVHGQDCIEEAVALAPRGTKTMLRSRIDAISKLRDQRRQARQSVPTVRECLAQLASQRLASLVDGLTPEVAGAGCGECTVQVYASRDWRVGHATCYGDRSSVAKSYKYPVIDHVWHWHLPYDAIVVEVHGVQTLTCRREWAARTNRPIRVYWIKPGRGYNLNLIDGWLWRGKHVVARNEADARKKAAALRRREARARLDRWHQSARQRIAAADPARVWVDAAAVQAAGACGPGLSAGIADVCAAIGGQVGAVRLDVLRSMGGHIARWADMAVPHAHVAR